MSHLETKILGTLSWVDSEGTWPGQDRILLRHQPHLYPGQSEPTRLSPAPDAASAPRCVVLKLASLGMFSFSLGQTILCIGGNKTSCESYGYNACDYQVADGSIRVCPFCAPPLWCPCPFEVPVPSRSHRGERPWAELPTPHCALEGGGLGCGFFLLKSYPRNLGFNLAIIPDSGQGSCATETPPAGGRGAAGTVDSDGAPLHQCWENAVGEELYRLSTFNFLLTVAFAFCVSLPRR